MKTSEAQRKANKKQREKIASDPERKAYNNYLTSRRAARSFINTKSTLEDLDELEQMIKERRIILK